MTMHLLRNHTSTFIRRTFCRASIFLNFSAFEPRNILKLFSNNKCVALPKEFRKYIPIFVDVLLHHESNQELMFCIDKAEVHLKAVLQRNSQVFFFSFYRYKKLH